MTNTDRLAQALRECLARLLDTEHNGTEAKDPVPAIRKGRAALAEYETTRAALASLAPAAVEGDAVERAWAAGNAEAAKRSQYGKPEPMDEDDRACLQAALAAAFPALTAQVAALTAQCEADAKRLDWIENWIFQAHWGANVSEPCTTWSIQTAWRHKTRLMYGPNDFRTAIDSAIAAGNGEGV